jgi:hypothetical protein
LTLKNQHGMTALDFAVRGQRANARELIETGLSRLAERQKRNQEVVQTPAVQPAAR